MKPYYEGWYMKQQQGDDFLAVIPGRATDNAFIQVITPRGARYLSYPLAAFRQEERTGEGPVMYVGRNRFSPRGMDVDVHEGGVDLVGRLRYRALTPLRSDIMGPFAVLPMETKHTVFSMRHQVDGEVTLNGEPYRFRGGAGYMEGDRGHSFPAGYTWVQTVDFSGDLEERGASVMIAIARIPLGPVRFIGCIAIVSIDGREYRLATYRGVRILQATKSLVELAQGDLRLRVDILGSGGFQLQAPEQGSMHRVIRESPSVPAHFHFERRGRTLLDAVSPRTSFEFVAE